MLLRTLHPPICMSGHISRDINETMLIACELISVRLNHYIHRIRNNILNFCSHLSWSPILWPYLATHNQYKVIIQIINHAYWSQSGHSSWDMIRQSGSNKVGCITIAVLMKQC